MAPPINPPSAFAILKADMLAVAASSGAALPYFMTRICIDGTLAKDAMPNTKAAARNGHLNGATKPATIRDAVIAAGQRMSDRRRFAAAECVADDETDTNNDQHPGQVRGAPRCLIEL